MESGDGGRGLRLRGPEPGAVTRGGRHPPGSSASPGSWAGTTPTAIPTPSAPGWLALEYLPPSKPGPRYGRSLGRGLAALHREVADQPGWPEDNLIGPLPQANPPDLSWPDFWRDARLEPQLRRAHDAGYFTGGAGRTLDDALDAVERVLEPVTGSSGEPASLLHGDLWGGNVHPGPDGPPVLVDPASYHGHREVDLAMSELFGGFPPDFLPAYREAWPLGAGYAEVRRALYQLYYLLVHVNLFGGGYVGSSLEAARRVAAWV